MTYLRARVHLVTAARPPTEVLAVVRSAVGAARSLDAAAELAVQVRVADEVADRHAYELTRAVLGACRPSGVLCLVNDRLHVGLAAGADGGHVGAEDLPVAAARRVLGPAAVLGATCRNPAEAVAAAAAGATYLGVGPCYSTTTKDGLPEPIGLAGIARVAAAVPGTPVVAIGGITAARLPDVIQAGAYGVAVVGAVGDAADPGRATAELLAACSAAVSEAGR